MLHYLFDIEELLVRRRRKMTVCWQHTRAMLDYKEEE